MSFIKIIIIFAILFSPLCFAKQRLIIEPDDGLQPITHAIQKAKSSIDLAMYGFTEPQLMQALIQAKNNNKTVRILLQHTPYKNENENLFAIQRFSSNHVDTRFSPQRFTLLHQKTLITDHHLAMIMTFNFTRSAFKNDRNFALVVTDPNLVQEIQEVFDADWQQQSINPHQHNLIWSPDNSRIKLLRLIQNAKSEIKIYAQGLSDYQVIGALAKAARKGIAVEILTSGTAPGNKWNYLQNAGVQIHVDKKRVIHAKVLMIDGKLAMLGSINFTKPSLDKNRELSMITHNHQVISKLLSTYQHDWNE